MKTITYLILILTGIMGCYSISIAQTQPQHEPKTFTGDDGKIYWNKSLPFYIQLSTNPSGSGGHIMKMEGDSAVNSYYFDTEGTNWIRTRWAIDVETKEHTYPLTEVLWPVEVDGLSPKTTISFDSEGKFVMGDVSYFTVDLKITLSATDATSGVNKIYYSTGQNFQEYTEPIAFDIEKEWALSYYAVDRVGNAEKVQNADENQMKVVTDGTPPVTTHELLEPLSGDILSAKSFIQLSSTDETVGLDKIYYSIDDGPSKVYSGKLSMSNLSEGEHTLTYYAVDKLGNEEEKKSIQFFVDRTGPEIEFVIGGSNYKSAKGNLYVSNSSNLSLNASDNKAGVEQVFYKLDNKTYTEYTSPITTDQSAGLHKFYFYGVDKVENKSSTKSQSYIVDIKEPAISYSVAGPKYTRNDTLFVNKESAFSISPSDPGSYQSGVKSTRYIVGNESEKEYSEKFSISGNGYRLLKLSANDQVDNSNSKEIHVFVDNDSPELTYNFSVDRIGQKTVRDKSFLIYPPEVQLYLGATDEHVGTEKITYSINGGTTRNYSTPVTGFTKGINYTIVVKLIDKLGNSIEESIEFSVE